MMLIVLLVAARVSIWLLVCGVAAYLVLACGCVVAFRPAVVTENAKRWRVTVLRPLCGDEPGLALALHSLLSQHVSADEIRFVFGVASAADTALPVARAIASHYAGHRIDFVINPDIHGANPKVSNLMNMAAGGLAELVVISDSDVILPPGSLQGLLDAAEPFEVGAVTALTRGRPGNPGSLCHQFGALYLDGWFLPTALVHARLASMSVCYGQLTAVKREVLDHGGGFEALRNALADDTELGHMTRRAGRRIVFAPHAPEVLVNDAGWRALFAHELRWARTIKALQPRGYAASVFMHPGPLPFVLAMIEPGALAWLVIAGLILLRWCLVTLTRLRFGRAEGSKPADPLTLWSRDQLYFAVWLVGFFGSAITWREHRLNVGPNATVKHAAAACDVGRGALEPKGSDARRRLAGLPRQGCDPTSKALR